MGNYVYHRGTILHSARFDWIDHGKLFVIIGENKADMIGFFFINSNINTKIWLNKRMLDMQLQLKRADYPDILQYDSFLGCHELVKLSKSILTDWIECGDAQIRGVLNEDDIELILDAALKSPLFTEEEKELYFAR
jgi:hypothetical protein